MISKSVISPIETVFQMARILVIDDDEAVRSVLTILLGQKAHQVVTAQDGRRGLKAVESDHFDLLIVDIFMPEMDGLEAIRLVRKSKPDLPIIVISGSAGASTAGLFEHGDETRRHRKHPETVPPQHTFRGC